MKILFLDQAMNWWFADRCLRCDLPDGIVGTWFIFLRINKLLKNQCVFSVVAVTSRLLPLQCSVNPVSLILLIKCHVGTFKTWMLLPDFVRVPTFFIKIIFNDSLLLSVKTILLRLSELGNCETSEQRPVTSTDFDLHCNGFLHCHNFFTRQRRKKTN